ncbi:MAG: type II toxin-antitoxin system VapC family toxin [Phycisphaerae bacterium]|nr:type II toxin-antitoxin system VapC family toxin [Phycisphaerae bacterium]
MSGSEIALDTNEAIAVLNNAGDTGRWVAAFAVVYLPVPVVGELCFGALNSRRANENRARIEALVKRCRVLDVNVTTAEVYADVRLRLKQAGKPIPENDVWIAALCIQHGLPLATSDEHFVHVDSLETVRR